MNQENSYNDVFNLYSKQNSYLDHILSNFDELREEESKTAILMMNDIFLLNRIKKMSQIHKIELNRSQMDDLTSIFSNLVKAREIIIDFDQEIWAEVRENKLLTFADEFSPLHLMRCIFSSDSQITLRPNTTISAFLKSVLYYLQIDENKIKDIMADEYQKLTVFDEITIEEFNSYLSVIFSLIDEMEDNTIGLQKYEELFKELNELIGLDVVKKEVRGYVNLVRANKSRQKMGMPVNPINLHMVFSGNPGTGKTTVARILSTILFKLGMVSKGHLVEVDRSMLVGGYVGQTAMKTKEEIEKAKGGILFIDEAYALTRNRDTVDFGIESIDTLVKYMEDYRDDLVIIMAGYTKEMKDFVQSNPGLTSRINQIVEFPDYDVEQLVLIFKSYCVKNHFTIDEDALELVQTEIAKLNADPKIFGNARGVRNLYEDLISVQSSRITDTNLLDNKQEINRLKAIDILVYNKTLQ